MTEKHVGGCLCGAVRYTLKGVLRPVSICHCQQCRRWSGHMIAATRPADGIEINDPHGHLLWYESSPVARRGFCRQCGSSLFWDSGGPAPSVMAGTLDDSHALAAQHHIFVADKGDYYDIADGLPQYEQQPPKK